MRKLSRFTSLLLSLTLAIAAFAETHSRGTWTAEAGKEPQTLQLNIYHHRDGQFGQRYSYSELEGLNPSAIAGTRQQVTFRIKRDAGTIEFTGEFNQGLGHGEYTFTANPEYIAAMKQQGFAGVEDEALTLTALDVSRAFVKEIRDLGYKPNLDELVQARIFKVGRQQVEELKAVGVTNLPIDKLVEYRIFNVTPDYIRQMRQAFPNISVDKMVEMRIHNATPEFANEMAQMGYRDLSSDDLVAFRIHGVTPEFIRSVRALGFKDLSADELVQFRIFGVNAEQINDLAKEGYRNLSADELVAFRIHHVDNAFIEKVKRAGHPHPSPDELVEYKIMGIRASVEDRDED